MVTDSSVQPGSPWWPSPVRVFPLVFGAPGPRRLQGPGPSADPAAPGELAQQIMASNRALGVLQLALPHEVGDVVMLVGVLEVPVVDLAGLERVVLDADEVVDDVVCGSVL